MAELENFAWLSVVPQRTWTAFPFTSSQRKNTIQEKGLWLANSTLCEKHFPPGSYPMEYELKKEHESWSALKKKSPPSRSADHSNSWKVDQCTMTPRSGQTDLPSSSSVIPLFTSTPITGACTPTVHVGLSPPKKTRAAFRKRECTLIVYCYFVNKWRRNVTVYWNKEHIIAKLGLVFICINVTLEDHMKYI